MSTARSVEAFPWATLPATNPQLLRAESTVRTAVRFVRGRLEQELRALLGRELSLCVRSVSCDVDRDALPSGLALTLATPAATLTLVVDPQLAASCAAWLLGKNVDVFREGELDPQLAAVWAALLLELCRRSDLGSVWLGSSTAPLPIQSEVLEAGKTRARAPAVLVQASLDVDGSSYALHARVDWNAEPNASRPVVTLYDLQDLSIELPVVAALATLSGAELQTLRRGDILMPGAGWQLGPGKAASRALATPTGTWGVRVAPSETGELVLRGGRVSLPLEVSMTDAAQPLEAKHGVAELTDVVLEAPLVVRVELGAVTLTARQWAELSVGDVIETGKPVGGPVVLRVAGHAVARGELVSIEGELGVRIQEITSGGTT